MNHERKTHWRGDNQLNVILVSRALLLVLLLAPCTARGNPYMLNPTSLIAFWVVAFWALVVEAGIVALLLAPRGLAVLRIFIAFFLANLAIFAFLFYPLSQRRTVPLPVLELMVVGVDGIAIKLLTGWEVFEAETCQEVTWLRAIVLSGVGNTASFFVGVIASGAPWRVHEWPVE